MSQVYVNGPAEIHVGTLTTQTTPDVPDCEFLGWTEAGVRLTIDGAFEDVMSDYSGSRIPFDVQFMGQQAFAVGDLNVYNEDVYRKIAGRFYLSGGGPADVTGNEGGVQNYTVGAMMGAERDQGNSGMFRLLIVGPYGRGVANKGVFASMDQCYNFPFAYLADAADLELGTRYKRIRTTFRAITKWGHPAYNGVLYNHDIRGRATLN